MEKDKELVRLSRTADERGLVDVTKLSEAEKNRCREITRSIKDYESLNAFGADIANARNEATHQILESNKVDRAGEIGVLVKEAVNAIRETEYEDPSSIKGIRGFILRCIPGGKYLIKTGDKFLMDKYYSAKDIVDKVVEELKIQQSDLKTDANTLEHMLQKTKAYIDQLGIHYVALAQYHADQLEELNSMRRDNESVPGTWSDQQLAEKNAFLDEIEQRGYDIYLSGQYNSNVLVPSIMKMKDNAIRLARNADQIKNVVLPNWEMSMSQALINNRMSKYADTQQMIRDTNNNLVRANAEMMKNVTTKLERESRRGIIDVEAYKDAFNTVTDALIESQKALQEAKSVREKNIKEIEAINKENMEKLKTLGEEAKRFYLDDGTIQTAKALE